MQKSLQQAIGLAVAVALIAAGGVVHGLMTDRWGLAADSLHLAQQFDSYPQQLGVWELEETQEMSPNVLKMLECDGYLARSYVNKETGEKVTVAVILGPPGPISVHTPEICYSTREYTIETARQAEEIKGTDGEKDQFWRLTLRSNDLHAHRLRVYYGWTTDGIWKADANPRFSNASEPYLVKVQVAGRIPQAEESTASDLCNRFLTEFTSQLREHLFTASKKSK